MGVSNLLSADREGGYKSRMSERGIDIVVLVGAGKGGAWAQQEYQSGCGMTGWYGQGSGAMMNRVGGWAARGAPVDLRVALTFHLWVQSTSLAACNGTASLLDL